MKSSRRHKLTKAYQNPHQKSSRRGFFHWVWFSLGLYEDKHLHTRVPENFKYPQKEAHHEEELPCVTWINHSTFLIEHEGIRILTDPIWSDRCSPVKFVGPKRKHPPGISIENLPHIDFVLLSHDHYDHLDKSSVLKLNEKYPDIFWMVPKGVKKWFKRHKIDKVVEFDWWQHFTLVDEQLKITAVPAQHFSGRHLLNINKTLWSGFVFEFLKTNKKVYFVGDTGYNPVQFQEIGRAFSGGVDLSLIPIGTYSPKKFMEPVHISPQEAVHIHRDVGSKLSIGSHYQTFNLSKEAPMQPPFDLYCAMEEAELDHNQFRVLQPGQKINW